MVTCNVQQLLLPAEQPQSGTKRKREEGESTPWHRGTCALTGGKRPRKQTLEARSCDSGVADLYDTPSPSPVCDSRAPADRDLGDPGLGHPLGLQNFRDYGQQCYLYKKGLEGDYGTAGCMARQPQLKPESRCKLISWLIPVHRHFCLGFESLCLAINIMDRFLAFTPVATDCFQLVGVSSLLIACKQVEVRPPRVKQLLALCCDAFSREQLCNLECIILLKLRFQLATPTINFFLQHFSLLPIADGDPSDAELLQASTTLAVAKGIAELSLADYAFNSYPPSLMAICCLLLAQRMLYREGPIRAQDSGYPSSQLQDCLIKIDLLVSLNHNSLQSLLPSDLSEKDVDH